MQSQSCYNYNPIVYWPGVEEEDEWSWKQYLLSAIPQVELLRTTYQAWIQLTPEHQRLTMANLRGIISYKDVVFERPYRIVRAIVETCDQWSALQDEKGACGCSSDVIILTNCFEVDLLQALSVFEALTGKKVKPSLGPLESRIPIIAPKKLSPGIPSMPPPRAPGRAIPVFQSDIKLRSEAIRKAAAALGQSNSRKRGRDQEIPIIHEAGDGDATSGGCGDTMNDHLITCMDPPQFTDSNEDENANECKKISSSSGYSEPDKSNMEVETADHKVDEIGKSQMRSSTPIIHGKKRHCVYPKENIAPQRPEIMWLEEILKFQLDGLD